MTRSYSSILFWLGMTIMASLMLYHTSDKVHGLDQRLHKLNAQIEQERKSLHVLKAEWVYLANPSRIETQAKRHLGMQLTTPARVAALRDMDTLLPAPDGVTPAPRQVAQAPAPPTPPAAQKPLKTEVVAPTKHERVLASINAGRINERMTMQTKPKATTDRIGALIGSLGLTR